MDDLLFLCHRLPYPPNKGDKIRSFNWLKGLSKHFRIHLGTFIDDPEDEQYVGTVKTYCESLHVTRIKPHRLARKAVPALLRREPISLGLYGDSRFGRWVNDTCRAQAIEKALVFSAGPAPYLMSPPLRHVHKVLDLVDVDSDKWRQYARKFRYARRWVYAREARCLMRAEKHLARAFDVSVLVSEAEADLFRQSVSSSEHVESVENGVDCQFFDPCLSYKNPYSQSQILVFTGAMDYAANVDAVTWFAGEVFPRVRARVPDTEFYVVGSRPTSAVKRLAQQPGIVVTGRVADVRPYLAHAAAVVAPLRMARGVQNKVLEALAMDLPVLATPQAVQGLTNAMHVIDVVSEAPDKLARGAIVCLTQLHETRSEVRRRYVQANYSWHRSVCRMAVLLNGEATLPGYVNEVECLADDAVDVAV